MPDRTTVAADRMAGMAGVFGKVSGRSRRRGWRLLLHPAVGLALFTASVWNMQHWPRHSSRRGSWPPGVYGAPALSPSRGPGCRTLAWVYRDGAGWRFDASPGPGEEDGSACTVVVLFEHGSFGRPYPTEVGLRSTRAIMHCRERMTVDEAQSIYTAAMEWAAHSDDPVDVFLAGYLRSEHTSETYPVRWGVARNTGAIALAGAGIAGGVWALTAFVLAMSVWRAALLRRRHERELLKATQCPACGYDLRGLPEKRCPECGFGWPEQATTTA